MDGKIRKNFLNATGKYYVDQDSCFWCTVCINTAPNNFALDANDSELGAYVFKQPVTPEEETHCNEAMMCCPHEAIFDNGEEELENAI